MKEKSNNTLLQKLFIAVFCGVLGLSLVVFNTFSKQLSQDNHENRLLTALPTVLQSAPRDFLHNLDAFLVDNAPFRYQFVRKNAELNYKLFGVSESDQVLAGKDGWLFFKDGQAAAQPMANYQGLPELNDPQETLAIAAQQLQRMQQRLAEHGCTLVLDITPSKDRIYQEYMPDGYPIVDQVSRADRMVEYFRTHTSVPIVWQRDALREQALANPELPLYYQTDTHWNMAGALLGADGIFQALGMETLPFEAYSVMENGTQFGDLTSVAALYNVLPINPDYRPSQYETLFDKDERMIGVLGDSFSDYYMTYLETRFTGAWRFHIDDYNVGVLDEPACDVLVISVTERQLEKLLNICAMTP
ncbi:MAG: hypothetical protein IJ347_03335 [Faecalibacterium sp.]|nr:hypothetical protein [Faecalibacterium sp.]